MYVCPDCKTPLGELKCPSCQHQYSSEQGIPILLTRDTSFQKAAPIGGVYDAIYSKRSKVWEDQGRTPAFIGYFAGLLGRISRGRVLEVGCGEGFLLAAIHAQERVAVDISREALEKARGRAEAGFSVALAERLPFASDSFDLVVSVGVMEHFLDDQAATREIWRVLKPGGHYIALIHVEMTPFQRVAQKVHEYFFPRFRPLGFAKWIASKMVHPVRQPIQRRYTLQTGRSCLVDANFTVTETITLATHPTAPLVGSHVVIYIARK